MNYIGSHGDVIVFKAKISELPEDIKLKKKSTANYLIAEGESTGHKHEVQFNKEAEILEGREETKSISAMQISEEGKLVHNTHEEVPLAPNQKDEIYIFSIQEEYDPIEKRRMVND